MNVGFLDRQSRQPTVGVCVLSRGVYRRRRPTAVNYDSRQSVPDIGSELNTVGPLDRRRERTVGGVLRAVGCRRQWVCDCMPEH